MKHPISDGTCQCGCGRKVTTGRQFDDDPGLSASYPEGEVGFLHCGMCVQSLPPNESPESYDRLSVIFTTGGVQVWCTRHGVNVAHIGLPNPTRINTRIGKTRKTRSGPSTLIFL